MGSVPGEGAQRQMIKGLGATITKNPHFLPKSANCFCLKQHFWGMSGQL